MNRQVPTLGKLLTIIIFALSVFGLTLFLWSSFGGSVPFKAQGYRINTSFPEATQLAVEADVRIAGVPVGRVKRVTPGGNGRAQVLLEVQRRFAPLPVGTKAILRQKTLLGETYIALTPPAAKDRTGKFIPERGRIPDGDVGSTVELDELFQTFNPETRRYFQQWMQDTAKGFAGQGSTGGRALVELQLLVSDLGGLTKTLDDQTPALKSALRDSTTVFNAATAQRGALTKAFVESERVFRQTGDQEAALTAVVERLPDFLANTKRGTKAIEQFAQDTGPATTRLRPTAKALAPAFKSLADTAPELRQLLEGVERVNKNAEQGLPATQKTLAALPVILDGLDPFFKQLNPIVEYASLFGDDLSATLGNLVSATEQNTNTGTDVPYRDGKGLHFTRGLTTLQPDSLTASTSRLSTNRGAAYRRPGWLSKLGQGLEVYSEQSCGTLVPVISSQSNARLDEKASARPRSGIPNTIPDVSLLDAIKYSLFSPLGFYAADRASTTPSEDPAPTTPKSVNPCTVQQQFQINAGRLTTYPQLPAAPTSTERSVVSGG